MEEIISLEQWEQLKKASFESAVIVFKHSMICPVSGAAHGKIAQGVESGQIRLPINVVIVQRNREICNKIASDLAIAHESPQLIVMNEGKAIYDASHFDIEPDDIAAVLKEFTKDYAADTPPEKN